MPRKVVKRGKAKEEHREPNPVSDVDRISKLPDPVIYHILSFVPTVYAVRTSVLSRRWRRIWHSVPALLFPDRVGFQHQEPFIVFVQKCLKHRRRAPRFVAGSSVTKFELEMCYSKERDACLSEWFHSNIIQNGVEDLSLRLQKYHLSLSDCKNFKLPSAALNGRALTRLRLENFVKISASCSVNLPSLKFLSLTNVRVGSKVLYSLVLGCPSLKECVLKEIWFKEDLRISSLSLTVLVLEMADEFEAGVKVEARNLESFKMLCGNSFRNDFSAIRAITDLELDNVWGPHVSDFEDRVSKFTRLENLTLTIGSGKEMRISNHNLKRLCLSKETANSFKLTIDARNLVFFSYTGDVNFTVSMSLSRSQVNGRFAIFTEADDANWLINFLSNINCPWESLALNVGDDKDLMVPQDLRKTCDPPLPNLKSLKVVARNSSTRKAELRKSLNWLCPSLETLSIENE